MTACGVREVPVPFVFWLLVMEEELADVGVGRAKALGQTLSRLVQQAVPIFIHHVFYTRLLEPSPILLPTRSLSSRFPSLPHPSPVVSLNTSHYFWFHRLLGYVRQVLMRMVLY